MHMKRFSVVFCTAAVAAIGVAAGAQAAPVSHARMAMPGRSAVVHVEVEADDVLMERADVEAEAEAADMAGDDAAEEHEAEPAEQEAEPEVEHHRRP
jgi:hypothetical protein